MVTGLLDTAVVVDLLITAAARRLALPLYTPNLKHFVPLLGDLARQPY